MKPSLSKSDSPVEITVNGEPRGIPAECTVQNLLDLLGMEGRRVAVARNRDIVPGRSTLPKRSAGATTSRSSKP